MNHPAMHVLDHGRKTFGKGIVANTAAKASGFLEIRLRKTAGRATYTGRIFFDLLRRSESEQQISQGESRWIINPFLLGARLAEINLLHFPLHDLSQENGSLLGFAYITEHW